VDGASSGCLNGFHCCDEETIVMKHHVAVVILLVFMSAAGAQAQVYQTGDLAAHIDEIIANMPADPDGGDYLQPALSSRDVWRQIVNYILAGNYSAAHTLALTKNYQVVLFTDTANGASALHVVLEHTAAATSRYWGTFVFNAAPRRSHLVIQSPHPRYDLNTGYQGIRIYQLAEAKAFFVSGTHRCNGLTSSPCDGTTTACSSGYEPYRYSDQAHVVDSTFQITTEEMLDDDPTLIIVQPHGFSQGTGDPDLIISNGTRLRPSGPDYAVAIRNAIQAIDGTLTAKVGHIDLSWTELLAQANTQGRLLNGSSSPCGTEASAASGAFVHIEQARIGLRDTQLNWMKLAQAVAAAIPLDYVSAVPDEIAASGPGLAIVGTYANPFHGRTRIEFSLGLAGPVELEAFDVAGRCVARLAAGTYPAGVHGLDWNAERLPAGTYFLRLRQGDRMDSRRCVLLR
jgi:hypothetical protein